MSTLDATHSHDKLYTVLLLSINEPWNQMWLKVSVCEVSWTYWGGFFIVVPVPLATIHLGTEMQRREDQQKTETHNEQETIPVESLSMQTVESYGHNSGLSCSLSQLLNPYGYITLHTAQKR